MSPVLIMSPVIKAIAHTLILGGIMVNPTLTPVTSAALAQTVPVAAPQDTGLMMLALSEPEPALKPLSSQPWAKAVLGASTITTKASGATLSSAKDATETKTVAHNPDKDVQSLKVTQDKKDTPARKAAPVLAAAALPKATFASIPQAETVQAALEGSTAKPLDSSVLANASAKPAINAKADLVSTLMQASPLTEERLVPAPDQIASAQVLPKQMPVAITQPGKAVMAVAPMAVTHPEAIAPNASAKLSSGNSSKLTQPVALTEAPPLLASAVTPTVAPALATSPVKNVSTGVSATLANLSANQVDLTLGKAVVIDLKKPASRISISDPETAQAVVISPSVVQLIGNQVGSTSLLVWFGNSSKAHQIYDVTVMRDMTLLQRQLKSIAPRVRVLPLAGEDTVVLAGEADTQIEAETAVSLAQVFLASRGGGSAAAGASNAGSSSGAAKKTGPSSQAVGSSLVSEVPKVMNMIQIKGVPSTKIELVKQQLLTLDSGIQLSVYKNEDGREKAVLTGKVPTPGIVSKAINLTSVFYGQPGLKVLTGPGGNSVRQTGDTNFPTETGFSTNMDINILQGSVISDTSGNVVSMLEVTYRPQIRCSIKFLDVTQAALKQLGSTLTGTAGDLGFGSFSAAKAPLAGKGIADFVADDSGSLVRQAAGAVTQVSGISQTFRDGVTQYITINNKLTTAISALEEERKVRSLAEPTLVLLSGEKASFLAGGEVPIPVIGGNGQVNVEYKEFGIRLNLIATVNDDGKVHLQVAPEVSATDPANSVSTASVSVPGFRTRRMQTTLELNPGESFVLAGLFNSEDSETVSKLPGLGNIPVLGALFRNRTRDQRDNELMVIIQPEVVMVPNG